MFFDPIGYCPECNQETYNTVLHLCLMCGAEGPFYCSRCGEEIPAAELTLYEETGGLCGYCNHIEEQLMKDD